jgi:plasmid maintenance system antidote protein VapI
MSPYESESPRRKIRRLKLQELVNECHGQAEFARLYGTPKSHISSLLAGKRGIGDDLASKLERQFDKPEGWFDGLVGLPNDCQGQEPKQCASLKTWLDAERGRATALAGHLNVSLGRVSQMSQDGVPAKYMLAVRDFTDGEVTLESLVKERTPPRTYPATRLGGFSFEPVDWQHLLQQLQELGITQVQIAARCGTKQSTISELARGESKEPRFALGQSLLALLESQLPTSSTT